MMNKSTEQPARGLPLTGWLILMALANAWAVYSYYIIIDDFVRHSDPRFSGTLQWALLLSAFMAALNIGAVALLWTWRKIGLYIFTVTSLAALVINLVLNTPVLTALLGLVGLVILWALLRPRWSHFY